MPILTRKTITQPEPLLAFLLAALQLKRGAVKNLLKHGAVAVNGQSTTQFDQLLSPGDEVTVSDLQSALATGRLKHARIDVVYEDDALIVVDKPSGLLTVATDREKSDTLFVRLNDYLRDRAADAERASVVHRLDQETSGLVLFAKTERVKLALQELWPTVEKTYWAVVERRPEKDEGTITSYLAESSKSLKVYTSAFEIPNSRLAVTRYRVLQAIDPPNDAYSLVEVYLETGRKHQIRVHLAELNCPVVGDRRYGARSNVCQRLGLHACRLTLPHPITGQPLNFASPMPRAFGRLFPGWQEAAGRDAGR